MSAEEGADLLLRPESELDSLLSVLAEGLARIGQAGTGPPAPTGKAIPLHTATDLHTTCMSSRSQTESFTRHASGHMPLLHSVTSGVVLCKCCLYRLQYVHCTASMHRGKAKKPENIMAQG